jgi:hypothetical protein
LPFVKSRRRDLLWPFELSLHRWSFFIDGAAVVGQDTCMEVANVTAAGRSNVAPSFVCRPQNLGFTSFCIDASAVASNSRRRVLRLCRATGRPRAERTAPEGVQHRFAAQATAAQFDPTTIF